MVNIYIDDSGTKNLKEIEQPVYLLSAVCVKNEICYEVENKIEKILEYTKKKIESTLYFALYENKYTQKRASKMGNMLSQLLCDNIELHCSEIIRGDNEFMVLNHKDRKEIIKDALNIVRDCNLKVISVVCDKKAYLDKYGEENKNNLENKLHKEMVQALIASIIKYLEDEKEQGCIIADEGNYTIKNVLIPSLKSKSSKILSSEVLEKASHERLAIQMADICAYTNNMKKKSEINCCYNRKSLSTELYAIINNNNQVVDIIEFFNPKVEKEII